MSPPGMGMPAMGMPTTTPSYANYLMVPRCTVRFEKCQGGFKMWCHCDDKMACSMVQNLCTMLAGGMPCCCCMYNGMTVCTCNFSMGHCKYEMIGDAKCAEMLQAFCDCMSCMMDAGCSCCFLINNTPVCCGCPEPAKTHSKVKSGK
jgi:hypothetical protein